MVGLPTLLVVIFIHQNLTYHHQGDDPDIGHHQKLVDPTMKLYCNKRYRRFDLSSLRTLKVGEGVSESNISETGCCGEQKTSQKCLISRVAEFGFLTC